MGPRARTRQEIIDLLAQAAEQAQHAEAYHAASADPDALQGRAANQAARDAAAMQLIELAGCAEGFTRNRGEPGTTLARLDDALRPVFEMRMAHTHPETGAAPPPITPSRLGGIIEQLKTSLGNLDSETLNTQPPAEMQALNGIFVGLTRIDKDGLPDPAALRPRDLHYAGYYHEIQFGRLAKATGLYDNWGKSPDARHVDINTSIFDADDMAHKFHAMRAGSDKSALPVSVVAPEHRNRVPGRALSELMSELRHEYQTPAERLAELETAAAVRAREQYRDSVQGLAQAYADITGDPKAAASIRDYVHQHEPRLDPEAMNAMRQALHVAAVSAEEYLALPEAVHDRCLEMCFALDEQGDSRLIAILNAAHRPASVEDWERELDFAVTYQFAEYEDDPLSPAPAPAPETPEPEPGQRDPDIDLEP
jgi:hypothetical protein